MGKSLMFNLSRTSTTSIIAIILVIGALVIGALAMFKEVKNENIAILVVGQIFGLAGIAVAYYYGSSKKTQGKDEAEADNDK